MLRYRPPRLTIGPKTSELLVDIGRTLNVTDEFDSVTLLVKRHKCGEQREFTFTSYNVCDTVAHFEIPEEFMQSDVPRGFYNGEIIIDGCIVTRIEIIKAPSRYIKSAKSVESDCAETKWQEPPCEEEIDNCSPCQDLDFGEIACGKSTVIVQQPIDESYLGEDDV